MEIMRPEKNDPVAVFDPFLTQIGEMEKKFCNVIYDLDTSEGVDIAIKDKKSIVKSINNLDAAHKSAKADALAKCRIVDGRRKEIKDRLLALRDGIANQLKEKARKEAELESRIDRLKAPENMYLMNEDTLKNHFKVFSDVVVGDSFFDRKEEARMLLGETLELVQNFISAKAEEREVKEKSEMLERKEKEIRRREEEVKEAEERERARAKEAEEEEKRIELRRIEKEKEDKEAEERRKAHAEREEERKIAQAKMEKEQAELKEQERKKEVKLARTEMLEVHRRIVKCMAHLGITESDAKKLIIAIHKNQIPALSIDYRSNT